jgi:redox-sensing transcriptional repressor
MDQKIAEQAVGRLSLYRRLLDAVAMAGGDRIYSHELAEKARVNPAQVRRDLMPLGVAGSTRRGYNVAELVEAIDACLDAPEGQQAAVIGVGNLGRALLAFFSGHRPGLSVVAGFDVNPHSVDRVIHGCRIYHTDRLVEVVEEQQITLAMLAVPSSAAQGVAEQCILAGVSGLLNFAPVRLRVPPTVYMLNVDLTMYLDMVAFFARQRKDS